MPTASGRQHILGLTHHACMDHTNMVKETQNSSMARQYLIFLADAARAETLSHERLALA